MLAERRTILLIDPDVAAARSHAAQLEPLYAVTRVPSAVAAREVLRAAVPDVIVFELDLPDADGLLFCAELRARARTALIVHTAHADRRDLLLSFRLGADDVIAKPADPVVIEARIGALVRRLYGRPGRPAPRWVPQPALPRVTSGEPQQLGDLAIDREPSTATLGGRPLHLTQTEFRLLSHFGRHLSRPLSRRELAQAAGSYDYIPGTRALDMHVRRLRAKLREGSERGLDRVPRIMAIRGVGYRMDAPAEQTASTHRTLPAA